MSIGGAAGKDAVLSPEPASAEHAALLGSGSGGFQAAAAAAPGGGAGTELGSLESARRAAIERHTLPQKDILKHSEVWQKALLSAADEGASR
jgi:hypothetical protein